MSRENGREVTARTVNPLICIRGSASPGHSYPMTPLHVNNTGDSPAQVSYSVNPEAAATWLKVSPVTIPAGKSANVPLTLAVPSPAAQGEDYVILTAGKTHFDVRFSVGVAAPRQCVAAGYQSPPAPPGHKSTTALLGLIVLVAIVVAILWFRRRR